MKILCAYDHRSIWLKSMEFDILHDVCMFLLFPLFLLTIYSILLPLIREHVISGWPGRDSDVHWLPPRTALHELALCYTSYSIFERPPQLNIKFIKIFSLLTKHGLRVNEVNVFQFNSIKFISSTGQHYHTITSILYHCRWRVDNAF